MARKIAIPTKRKKVRRLRIPLWSGRTATFTWTVSAKKKPTKKQLAAKKVRQTQASLFLLLFGAVGIVYFGVKTVSAAIPDQVVTKPTLVTPYKYQATLSLPAATPTQVSIPAIGVSADLMRVMQSADGSLEVPNSGGLVGYYGQGPTPGEVGPAVLVGHVDTYTGPAVFQRLHELQPGHIVTVARQDGTNARFRVTRVQSYDQNNFPTEEVYGNIDHAGLRLITCGGTFNVLNQRYSHNTVVYATLIP